MSAKYIIEDFNHFGGIHCETSAVRKIFLYNNLSISEEMLFGLGGGIGFIYWYVKMMLAPMIGGRGGGRYFIEDAIRRAGAKISIKRTSSSKKGHQWLVEKLQAYEPAMLYVDMAYLPYMGVPEDAHFGQHVIVVYGVDEEEDFVSISDRGARGVTVTVDELKQARASKYPPWPPKHAIFDFELPQKLEITSQAIKDALTTCIDGMMNPPIKNFGLAGFLKWANLVVKWPDMFSEPQLLEALSQGFIYIETGGTGGSAFRPMFCRFLSEVDEILPLRNLETILAKYMESAHLWSEIATDYLPDEYPVLRRIRKLLLEKNQVFEEQRQNATQKLGELNKELNSLVKDALIEIKDATRFLRTVKEKILRLYEVEKEAVQFLQKAIL